LTDEGYIKFHSCWQRTGPLPAAGLEELIRWRRPLFNAGLVGYCDDSGVGYGNISTRTPRGDRFLISGTRTGHLAEVGPQHFALVTAYDIDRNTVWSRGPVEASSESLTHAAIYELDGAIGAVVHVHSAELWVALRASLPETGAGVAYGTPQMAMEFRRLFADTEFAATGVARMAGHEDGLVSTGRTVKEAAERILALAG
jgi:ribulose-5-phosphate 4-epimerase/fuculose-1-phosphate aldolase